MQSPLQTSTVEIGRQGNRITSYHDGSMVFSDALVPGVRLIDLIGGGTSVTTGGSGIGLPAVIINVSANEWQFEVNDPIYDRDFWYKEILFNDIGFDANSNIDTYVSIATSYLPLNTQIVEINSINITNDRIKYISSTKIDCYITIKKI